MSTQTFSRAFLQSAPLWERQRRIDRILIITGFVENIQNAAIQGKTQYVYIHKPDSSSLPEITRDDLIPAFNRKFPYCDISYKETWVEVDPMDPSKRVLQKSIVIDWS